MFVLYFEFKNFECQPSEETTVAKQYGLKVKINKKNTTLLLQEIQLNYYNQ